MIIHLRGIFGMLFRVPFVYSAEVVLKNHSNGRTIDCGEWLDVDVMEVSSMEAPIATRWKESTWHGKVTHETRWFDGHHYMPVGGRTITTDEMSNLCLHGVGHDNPLVTAPLWRAKEVLSGSRKALSELQVRRTIRSERDHAIREVETAAAKLIIVDDTVWAKVHEPIYEYDGFFVRPTVSPARDSNQSGMRFRADRIDDMIDHFGIAASEAEDRIDVLIPESLLYDDETPAFLENVNFIISATASSVAGYTKEGMMVWADLRDAYYEALEETSNRRLDALEAALRTYADFSPPFFNSNRAEAALNRWSLRPITVDTTSHQTMSL